MYRKDRRVKKSPGGLFVLTLKSGIVSPTLALWEQSIALLDIVPEFA